MPHININSTYNIIFNEQKKLQDEIKDKKKEIEEKLKDFEKLTSPQIRIVYDKTIPLLERFREQITTVNSKLTTAKTELIENMDNHLNEINNITLLLDNFTKTLNQNRISTLENLARDSIGSKRNLSGIHKSVFEQNKHTKNKHTKAGSKRSKTVKKRY